MNILTNPYPLDLPATFQSGLSASPLEFPRLIFLSLVSPTFIILIRQFNNNNKGRTTMLYTTGRQTDRL